MRNNETNLSSVKIDSKVCNSTFVPKIGIVIPIYNVAQYLRQCLDSVLAQSYGNFYAVLVNDGSTDYLEANSNESSLRASEAIHTNNDIDCHDLPLAKSLNDNNDNAQISESLKIALEYVAKDSRFCCFDKENGGLSSARNVGIYYFGGEYNSSLVQSLREIEKFSFDRQQVLSQSNFSAQPTKQGEAEVSLVNLTQDARIATFEICINSTQMKFYTNPTRPNITPPKIDYIVFLDSDDFWESDLLEQCVQAVQNAKSQHSAVANNNAQICHTEHSEVSQQNKVSLESRDISVSTKPQYDKNKNDLCETSNQDRTNSPSRKRVEAPHDFSPQENALPDIVWFSWNNVFEFTNEQDRATRERERE